MLNFPTWIPDCDSHSPALLNLFISSDASICSTMAVLPLGKSDHVVVSVSIDFPYSQLEALFHCIAYAYSYTERCSMGGSLNSVLLLLLVNFVNGSRLELMYISLIESIRSSLTHLYGFSCLCSCHSS